MPRTNNRAPRQATITVRTSALTILPPRHYRQQASLSPLSVYVILAEEEQPPPGVSPICWLLRTTLLATTLAAVLQCIRWYRYRWMVERYHYVLTSGCRLEDLQLEHAARIQRVLATYCIVAWRLLWLTYETRQNPTASCELALEPHEWQVRSCIHHHTPIPPATPPTLRDAVRWIAHLGGFLGT